MARAVVEELGQWWRFSRYQIVDGRITRAPDARLSQYDPWANYHASRSRGGSGDPPYQSLLSLLHKVDYRPDREGFVLKPSSENLVTDWCARHGLLGILPQIAERIDLPALASSSVPDTGVTIHDVLKVTLPTYLRTEAGWVGSADHFDFPETEHRGLIARLIEAGLLENHPEDPRAKPGFGHCDGFIPFDWADRLIPSDRRRGWQPGVSYGREWATLTDLARSFFPGVALEDAETYPYPMPLDEEFWYEYAEPVDNFLTKAGWLQTAIEHIGKSNPDSVVPGVRMEGDLIWYEEGDPDFWVGKQMLDSLAGSASRVLAIDKGHLRQLWLFPSLLASYAMMIAEDFTEDRAVHVCKECGTHFLSRAYQVKFCSDTCRHRHQKREQRRRKGAQA